jgi:hypothetical protein
MAALPYAVDTCRPTLSPLGSSSSPLAVDDGLHLVDDHLNLGTAVAPPVAHGCLGVDQLPLECDLPRGGNLVIMSSRPPWSASTMGGRGGSTRCNMKGAECGEELWHRADSGTGCGSTGVPGIDAERGASTPRSCPCHRGRQRPEHGRHPRTPPSTDMAGSAFRMSDHLYHTAAACLCISVAAGRQRATHGDSKRLGIRFVDSAAATELNHDCCESHTYTGHAGPAQRDT